MNRINNIQKSIKIPIFFPKKIYISYYVSFVINKRVFLSLIQTKWSIFLRKIIIIQNINSYNLQNLNPLCRLVFVKKKLKNGKNKFFTPVQINFEPKWAKMCQYHALPCQNCVKTVLILRYTVPNHRQLRFLHVYGTVWYNIGAI